MGEVLGEKVYGKLTILFKYFQDMCMIYSIHPILGLGIPSTSPATNFGFFSDTKKVVATGLQKAGTSDGR